MFRPSEKGILIVAVAKKTAADKQDAAEKEMAIRDLDFSQLSTESRAARNALSDAKLREIATFDDAEELVTAMYGDIVDVTTQIGNGFIVLDKVTKAKLVDVPFIILSSGFVFGDFGSYFASMSVVAKDGGKYIVNDGGAGILEQLRDLATATGRFGGFKVPHGLRASTYATCPDCEKGRGQELTECPHCGSDSSGRGKATTYYLDLTPA